MTIKAIYEGGVFKPLESVQLAEHTRVDVMVADIAATAPSDPVKRQAEMWSLLAQRFDGGDPQVAQRHNEHQP